MAESTTPRLGLPRWTEDTDSPNRAEFDAGFASLEEYAAGWLPDTTAAARPAPTAANARFLHRASDTGQLAISTGTAWVDVLTGAHIADADPHAGYMLANGSRAFTDTVSGVTPTANAHLATKSYVDAGPSLQTYTPSLSGISGTAYGTYIKIGKMVQVWIRVVGNNPTFTSTIGRVGLPIACSTATSAMTTHTSVPAAASLVGGGSVRRTSDNSTVHTGAHLYSTTLVGLEDGPEYYGSNDPAMGTNALWILYNLQYPVA